MATETDNEESENEVSPHVHVKIGRDKKRKWLEYANEHYRGNLSTLVVDSVDKTLAKYWVLKDEEELEDEPRVEVDLSAVNEDMAELKEQTSTILGKIDGLVSGEVDGEGLREIGENELIQIANEIHDVIPLVSDVQDLDTLTVPVQPQNPKGQAKLTGKAGDISSAIGTHIYHVREAAIYLEQKDRNVHSILDEGERRWFILDKSIRPSSEGEAKAPTPEFQRGGDVDES
jgi:hypothetical protein